MNGAPASSPSTAYGLALLSEYTHTLDSVPVDLSRSFGDLRELDAVLSSSITLLTAKVNELINMIETKAGTNDVRLFLLTEIGEEAARLRLGGEDKIRVACHAADGLRAHKAHMKALLDLIPDQEFARSAEALSRRTAYPHVATRNFYPPGMAGEGGRRNRRAAGATYNGLLVNGVDASPGKRKRVVARDDDADVTRTPSKKERVEAPKRNGARPKRCVPVFLLCHCSYIAKSPTYTSVLFRGVCVDRTSSGYRPIYSLHICSHWAPQGSCRVPHRIHYVCGVTSSPKHTYPVKQHELSSKRVWAGRKQLLDEQTQPGGNVFLTSGGIQRAASVLQPSLPSRPVCGDCERGGGGSRRTRYEQWGTVGLATWAARRPRHACRPQHLRCP